MALTDTAIKVLRPVEKRFKVFDSEGLYLEVLPTGSNVWRVKYIRDGRDRRITLGHYPSVTLKDARQRARAIKNDLACGIDPARKQVEEEKKKNF